MVHPTQSAPLALPRNSMPDRGHWATVSPVSHKMFAPTEVLPRPVNPAELAQARLFEKTLEAEFVELNRIAGGLAARPTASQGGAGGSQPPQLSRIHARIGEVHRLIEALRDRFPHVRLASELPSASA